MQRIAKLVNATQQNVTFGRRLCSLLAGRSFLNAWFQAVARGKIVPTMALLFGRLRLAFMLFLFKNFPFV